MYKIYMDGELIYSSEYATQEFPISEPVVKIELNKANSLMFNIYPGHPFYDRIIKMASKVEVIDNDAYLFRGRVLRITTSITKERKVECEGDIAYLIDSVSNPIKGKYKPRKVFTDLINSHNSQVEEDKRFVIGEISIDEADIEDTFDMSQYNDTWSTIQDQLIDYYGGYVRTRYEDGITYIDYMESYDRDNKQIIEFGSNLIDINVKTNTDDFFTQLIPIGANDITIESVNSGSKVLADAELVAQYGKITAIHEFSNAQDASTLKKKAQQYMERIKKGYIDTLEIKALDLHLLNPDVDKIMVGDKVHVRSLPHSVDTVLTCLSAEYSLSNPQNSTFKIGDATQVPEEKKLTTKVSETKVTAEKAHKSAGRANAKADNLEGVTSQLQSALNSLKSTMESFKKNLENAFSVSGTSLLMNGELNMRSHNIVNVAGLWANRANITSLNTTSLTIGNRTYISSYRVETTSGSVIYVPGVWA